MAAKITRYNGDVKAFAVDAPGTERTIFGEVTQANDLTSQLTADYLRGWGIVGPADQPSLQDFNAMGFTLGQFIAYLHQVGVAEYNASQEYHLNSVTNSGGVLYVSKINSNVGNTPSSSPTQWKELYGQATETISGIATVATQAEAEAGLSDTDLMTPLKVKQAIAAQVGTSTDGISGSFSGLKVTTTGLSAAVLVTANSICVKNSANAQKVLNNVNLNTLSFANAGANGLDVGAGGSQLVSSWYYVFVIWNSSTNAVAGLLSLSLTPVLPAGFTHKGLASAVRTEAAGSHFPLRMIQTNDFAQYTPLAATNTPVVPVASTGVIGNPSGPVWAAIPVTAFVPPNAMEISIVVFAQTQAAVAPNNNYGSISSATNPPPYQWVPGVTTSKSDVIRFLLESTNIYGIFTSAAASVGVLGWRLQL